MSGATTVGIDLGTTVSMLARAGNGGSVDFAKTRDGGSRLRSVVAVDCDPPKVGDSAVRGALIEPDSTFAFFKRSMGTDWQVEAGGRRWTPQDLSAEVLKALAVDAEQTFGERPRRAAVTIPAYFGDDARLATREAAEMAGIEPLRLIHEPTAASLAYEIDEDGRTVLVYDLGGGTFDVSVVRFSAAGQEVLATLGDHRLGGKDWDDAMVELIVESLDDGADDPRDDPALLADLQERAREAKHTLSRLERTAVTVPTPAGARRVEVSREDFLGRTAHLFDRTEEILTRLIDGLGSGATVDEAILVGGSTRMPPCGRAVERATGLSPRGGVDPDEAVARGAALFAAAGAGAAAGASGVLGCVRDVTAHALGFVVVSADGKRFVNEVMIECNAPIPARAEKTHRLHLGPGQVGSLEVHMLQGEVERPLDNQSLGCWRFEEIPVGSGSGVDVSVAYEYDSDGVVHVRACAEGGQLADAAIDRFDRDLAWTDEEPGAAGGAGLAVALVIDTSSSMAGTKMQEAKAALNGFVDVLEESGLGDRVALVSFSSTSHCTAQLGTPPAQLRSAAEGFAARGSTDMTGGLEVAWQQLESQAGRRVVVLLTDGVPSDPDGVVAVRDRLVGEDVDIFARGVQGANLKFLQRLATVDGELLDLADLAGSFRGIARQLAGEGSLQRAAR